MRCEGFTTVPHSALWLLLPSSRRRVFARVAKAVSEREGRVVAWPDVLLFCVREDWERAMRGLL